MPQEEINHMAQASEQTKSGTKSGFRQEFEALPLDQKISQLFQMEMTTLNEAAKYVADSSMRLFEKFGEVLTDVGTRVEAEAKKATTVNCDPGGKAKSETDTKAKAKTSSRKKAPEARSE